MTATKAQVIATVKTAIHTPAPRLITFVHTSTITDEEMDEVSYGFAVNGVSFTTDWVSTEEVFMDLAPTTSALTILDLKRLLTWLEHPGTKLNKAPAPVREYLGAE